MSVAVSDMTAHAARLRADFDGAFAAPRRADAAARHNLLAIRVGAEPCAIRLAEITGLFAGRAITRIPGGAAALLGIAGFRGALLPVYSLHALLGLSGTPATRWLVVAAAAPVALAFDVFEHHLLVPADAILPRQADAGMRGFAPAFIRAADVVRPVLHLPSVIEALGAAGRPAMAPKKE